MRPGRLLARLRRGRVQNVAVADCCRLVEQPGFILVRGAGSHHIYRHQTAPSILSLQHARGCAKPCQTRRFLRTMDEYGLDLRRGR